jgi:hypothetical protein
MLLLPSAFFAATVPKTPGGMRSDDKVRDMIPFELHAIDHRADEHQKSTHHNYYFAAHGFCLTFSSDARASDIEKQNVHLSRLAATTGSASFSFAANQLQTKEVTNVFSENEKHASGDQAVVIANADRDLVFLEFFPTKLGFIYHMSFLVEARLPLKISKKNVGVRFEHLFRHEPLAGMKCFQV